MTREQRIQATSDGGERVGVALFVGRIAYPRVAQTTRSETSRVVVKEVR